MFTKILLGFKSKCLGKEFILDSSPIWSALNGIRNLPCGNKRLKNLLPANAIIPINKPSNKKEFKRLFFLSICGNANPVQPISSINLAGKPKAIPNPKKLGVYSDEIKCEGKNNIMQMSKEHNETASTYHLTEIFHLRFRAESSFIAGLPATT